MKFLWLLTIKYIKKWGCSMDRLMKVLILLFIIAFIVPVYSFAFSESQSSIVGEALVGEAIDNPAMIQKYFSEQLKGTQESVGDKNDLIDRKKINKGSGEDKDL